MIGEDKMTEKYALYYSWKAVNNKNKSEYIGDVLLDKASFSKPFLKCSQIEILKNQIKKDIVNLYDHSVEYDELTVIILHIQFLLKDE